ncbi:MAG TPA: hypothetical protein VFD36_20595 [Kofleriaceae bacterium]|nr:hypothetical protein [Kofleriaceae bacterium]
MTDSDTDETISDAELEGAVNQMLSDEDIRQRLQALEDAQNRWDRLRFAAVPKQPCDECGGRGMVGREVCVGCMGKRVVDAPDAEDFECPDFAAIRGQITAYAAALDDRALPDGHRIKKNLALPPASSVPDMASIKALDDQAKARMSQLRQIGAGAGPDVKALPDAEPPTGFEGDGDLGDVPDAEIDELVDDAEAKNPLNRRGRR